MKKQTGKAALCALLTAAIFISGVPETAQADENSIVINEIESKDADGGNDWVEIYNKGNEDVDISKYYITDSKGTQSTPLPDGTILKAGEVLVLEENNNFTFGIGKTDTITLYNADNISLDSYTLSRHADGTYQRIPDGTGDFTDAAPTKGAKNSPDSGSGTGSELNTLFINEINSSPDDWVEFMNTGSEAINISGYEIRDNSDDHRWKFPEGTVVSGGSFLTVEANSAGLIYDQNSGSYVSGTFEEAIGIGSGDSIRLYDTAGNLLDEYTWTAHASYNGDAALASYGRYPDGTGAFCLMKETKNANNEKYTTQVVINEIESDDPNGGSDWVELANPGTEEIDVSGLVIKDSKDSHEYTIPDGTTIAPGGFLVIDSLTFGLGDNDEVRIFEDGTLIQQAAWTSHAPKTLGLYPDAGGTEYRNTKEATPGAANKFADIPDAITWPGGNDVTVYDTEETFLEDSSGLDFYQGQLYLVDNGTGKFWIMDVADDGTLTFAEGFENGKRVRFQKDDGNASAAGPDAEGITVDGNGMVYIASERDNSNKGVNYDTILMVDPKAAGTDLTAITEWDITNSLPSVSANMGIESVEWVSNADAAGLIDKNTGKAFDASLYPNAISGGLFFVALEDNGHVYGYVLNRDGTFAQIADIDSRLGGAMALDYDTYENVLWVVSDNGYGNKAARITWNGTENPDIVFVLPPDGIDAANANNEGFAIADKSYTKDGLRPVYRFQDGLKKGALTIGTLSCDYIKPVQTEYTFIEGADQTINQDGKTSLTGIIDAEFSKFTSIEVNGTVVSPENYETSSGSTVITIKASYLEKLSLGRHTLKVNFTDGSADTTFTLQEAESESTENTETETETKSGTGSTSGNNGSASGKANGGASSTTKNVNGPKTGDTSAWILWLCLTAASAALIIRITVRHSRKEM